MITAIILTYNDECQIADCVKSVLQFTSDIVIIDSHSTDKTVSICEFRLVFMPILLLIKWFSLIGL